MTSDFSSVTELAGTEASLEQIERLAHRYYWAAEYCRGLDVLEVACGAGLGLGYLASVSKSLRAGDISPSLVARARAHYGGRVEIEEMDAQQLPAADGSLDVVILFEAIYYLPSAEVFVRECGRVLRPGGRVLIVTANKDLYDFNPSPFSCRYFGVVELEELFRGYGFSCEFYGKTPVVSGSRRQRALRPIKALAARLGLVPKTMTGKKLLKRLVFGKLAPLPSEVRADTAPYIPPEVLAPGKPDHSFKVIYMAATLNDQSRRRG